MATFSICGSKTAKSLKSGSYSFEKATKCYLLFPLLFCTVIYINNQEAGEKTNCQMIQKLA